MSRFALTPRALWAGSIHSPSTPGASRNEHAQRPLVSKRGSHVVGSGARATLRVISRRGRTWCERELPVPVHSLGARWRWSLMCVG